MPNIIAQAQLRRAPTESYIPFYDKSRVVEYQVQRLCQQSEWCFPFCDFETVTSISLTFSSFEWESTWRSNTESPTFGLYCLAPVFKVESPVRTCLKTAKKNVLKRIRAATNPKPVEHQCTFLARFLKYFLRNKIVCGLYPVHGFLNEVCFFVNSTQRVLISAI